MTVIDIHAHIYPYVAGITQGQPMTGLSLGRVQIGNRVVQFLPPSFESVRSTAEMLLGYMDWRGVQKALLMANPYYGYHNDYFIEAVTKYPDRFKGVALVDINKGEDAARELAALYDNTPLFGFKVETDSTFQCAPGRRMTDEACAPVWQCVNDYRQPAFIHPFTQADLEDIRALAQRYQDIRFIICHMGADACFGPRAAQGAYDFLLETAQAQENIWLDTSTVPVYFGGAGEACERYPFPQAQSIIEKGYRALGPERLLWSSDYPGMINHATYQQLIDLVAQHPAISDAHKEMILGSNAARLFF